MTLSELHEIIINLPFDEMRRMYSNGEQTILVYRPSQLSARFKYYDVNTNFQIYLQIGDEKPFKPNHLRLLLDLKLRSRELPASKDILLEAFDNIFYGIDPIEAIGPASHIPFTQYINPIDITAVLAQLFIIEQNIGYGSKSNYNPPSLYIQGWIRSFINEDQEIDQIVYRIARNTPPLVKYTCQDDKGHCHYNKTAKPLWYKY